MNKERLEELLEKNGMTMNDLGRYINRVPQTICKWKTNQSEPTATDIKKMAAVFGVSTDYILDYDEAEAKKSLEYKDKIALRKGLIDSGIMQLNQDMDDKDYELLKDLIKNNIKTYPIKGQRKQENK